MPNYDAECATCGYESIVMVKLSDLPVWDRNELCPNCSAAAGAFRRVMKQAPASSGSVKKKFANSGELSRMQQNQLKKTNHQQIAAAKDRVKNGEFENF